MSLDDVGVLSFTTSAIWWYISAGCYLLMSLIMILISISYSITVFKKVCIKHDPFDSYDAEEDETAHMNDEEKKYFYVLLIVTLLTILCYTASMSIITALDFITPNKDESNIHLTIFACLTAVRFAASLYLVAKECLYLVFILRLHVIYGETYFKYRPKLLALFAIGTLLFTIALLVVTQLTMVADIVYTSSPSSLINEFNVMSCDIAIPDYVLLLFVVFDAITSSVLSYLFIRPLKTTFNATVHDKEMRDRIKANPRHLGRLRDLTADGIHSMNSVRQSMSHSARDAVHTMKRRLSSLPPMRHSQMMLSQPSIPEESRSNFNSVHSPNHSNLGDLAHIDSLTEVQPDGGVLDQKLDHKSSKLMILTPPEDIPSNRPSGSVQSQIPGLDDGIKNSNISVTPQLTPAAAPSVPPAVERNGSIYKMESLSKSETERSRALHRQLTPESAQTVQTNSNTNSHTNPSSPGAPPVERRVTNSLSEQDAYRRHRNRDRDRERRFSGYERDQLDGEIEPRLPNQQKSRSTSNRSNQRDTDTIFHEQHLSHLTKENQLIKKYLVVTHVAVITTIFTLVFVMVTDLLGFIVVDMLVHCICVAMMSKKYNAYYRVCCCGSIFLFDLMEECMSCCARDEELIAIKKDSKNYDASDVKNHAETESLSKSGENKKWTGT